MCPDPGEQAYFTAILSILEDIASTHLDLGSQSMKAGNNPSLLRDGQWILDTSFILVRYNDQADTISALRFPYSVRHIHNKMLELADTLDALDTSYSSGLVTLNMNDILAASVETERSGVLDSEIGTLAANFCIQ